MEFIIGGGIQALGFGGNEHVKARRINRAPGDRSVTILRAAPAAAVLMTLVPYVAICSVAFVGATNCTIRLVSPG